MKPNKVTISYSGTLERSSGVKYNDKWSDRGYKDGLEMQSDSKILGFQATKILVGGLPIEDYIRDRDQIAKDCEELERDVETFMDAIMDNKSLDGSMYKSVMIRKLACDVRERINRERRDAEGFASEPFETPFGAVVGSTNIGGSMMTMSKEFVSPAPEPAPTLKELVREYAETLISAAMKEIIVEITEGKLK